jgi:uncharacterized protein (TIGR03437 family)
MGRTSCIAPRNWPVFRSCSARSSPGQVYTKPAMRNLIFVACILLGPLQAHKIELNPDPMNLPFGGRDGTITLVIVGDEPSPDCPVVLSASPDSDLVSVTKAGPQPAPVVALTVHPLRQPQGQTESTKLTGSWRGVTPCADGPFSFTATVTVTRTVPVISSVVNGASFLPGIQAGSWTTINGNNLANSARIWNAPTEIVSGKLPVALDGVSVTINNKAAVVYYISPTQLDVLGADDPSVGPVEVKVSFGGNVSAAVTSQLQKYSPAFFMFDPQSQKYIAAQIARSDGGVDFLGPSGLFGSALTTRPVKPGEVMLLYGTGFGPTNPIVPSGQVFTGAAPTTDAVTVTVGGVDAKVQFAGISGSGLYQLNVVVPALGDGDQKVMATVGGLKSQDNTFVAVKN